MKNVIKIIAVLAFIVAIVVNIQSDIERNKVNIGVEQAFAGGQCLEYWDDWTYGFRAAYNLDCEEYKSGEWEYVGFERECIPIGTGCETVICLVELENCRAIPF